MEIILNNLEISHKTFIRNLFKDEMIEKYIILADEAKDDVGVLVDIWLENVGLNAGLTYIVCVVEPATLTRQEQFIPCGFISFQRRDWNCGRITFALEEKYRGKGLIKTGLQMVLEVLQQAKIEIVEADIDRDNVASEKIVELLGFTTDKAKFYFDSERGSKLRRLWKKQLN